MEEEEGINGEGMGVPLQEKAGERQRVAERQTERERERLVDRGEVGRGSRNETVMRKVDRKEVVGWNGLRGNRTENGACEWAGR